jgi:hypothetical protein
MSDLKSGMLGAAVRKLLVEKISEADRDARGETLEQLLAAHNAMGVKTLDVMLPDGSKVARATLPQPKAGVTVDDKAFMEWVAAEHPTEIVEAVREPFRRVVLKRLEIVGDDVIDKQSGEVVPWASVRPAAEKPSNFTVTFVGEGRAEVEQAWLDGRINLLDFTGPSALPAEPGEAA